MAGIGFVLRRLTQRDDLLGLAQGYVYSAMVSSGPWLLTVLAIAGVSLIGGKLTDTASLDTFRIIIIYNFGFSLLFSGPILMVATRYLADRIYLQDARDAPSLYLGALGLIFATQAPIVLPFYLWYVDVAPLVRIAAVANYFLVDALWLITVFLSAIKDYRTVAAAFAVGMASAVALALWLAEPFDAAGLLVAFSVGVALVCFIMTARMLAEYPYPFTSPWGFLGYFRRYRDLALIGFVANAGAWADKWVMWCSDERQISEHGLVSYPPYDSAMFLAYLTIVPTLAVFIVNVETSFFEQYQRYYREIQNHATLSRIRDNQHSIVEVLLKASRNILVLQAVICCLAILLSPQIFAATGIGFGQIAMFRIGTLGAMFHGLMLFAGIILSYFDLRRDMLTIQSVFLALNAGLTAGTLWLGFPYYGYGYFLAALIGFLLSYAILIRRLSRLPYLTFVVQNSSVG